jgi:hypothetical protein
MRRIVFLAVLAAFAAIAVAVPASAESTQDFKAEFNEMGSCPGVDLCGKGILHGFGTVTTTLVFTSFVPGPGANCFNASADRTQTLDSDRSVLLMTASGTVCDSRIAGTFTIVGGTGVFAGASGGGTLWGSTTNPHTTSQNIHLRGTITLP